jgi:hypothetical protein
MPTPHRSRRSQPPLEKRIAALSSPVRLRLAAAGDLGALERLAGLDSRRLPPGPHLVAERDGRIDAALSLRTDEHLADPFRRTAELCELLRCHAGGARVAPREARATRLQPRPRLVPA